MLIKLILADDHPVFREGIAALIGTRKGLQVVGEASTGEEAVALAHDLGPDLVLMDFRMPGIGGLEATRRIREQFPAVRVVILTASEEEDDLFEAVRAGAQGYIVKNLSSSAVLELIEKAANGEAAFTPALASKALLALGNPKQPAISQREREVLEQLVKGHGNAVIANSLGLSETTVRFHLRNILSKLQAHSRTEAAVQAVSRHLVRPPYQDDTE